MENTNRLTIDKGACIVYQAVPSIDQGKGWIGGNAPSFFDDFDMLGENEKVDYHFYLSIVNPFEEEKMISIFIPVEDEERIENNIYPNCSILVIEHQISSESSKKLYTNSQLIKHFITEGEKITDKESFEIDFLIKFGGTPKHIQEEEYFYSELEKDNFSFICQIDEEGYPETLLQPNTSYPFNFGALYLYENMQGKNLKSLVCGYWQFS